MTLESSPASDERKRIDALERELAECRRDMRALRVSEEKFRHFFEKSTIMIYVTDRAGHFLNINEVGARLMGFDTVEEVIGLRAQDYFFVNPGDRLSYIRLLNRHKGVSEFETEMRRVDGSVITVQVTASARSTLTGKTTGYEGFVLDITERKRAEQQIRESEEKYRTVLENSLSAIYVFQDGGVFSYVNRRMVDILGYDRPEEIIGLRFWEVIAPEDREVVKERGLKREQAEIYPRRYIFKMLKKDGSLLWADMQAAHAYYMGRPAVVGNFIDITKIAEAEKEVRHLSRKLIEGIEEERRSLSADLHDEFGQMLTLLQFDTENLQASLPEALPESKAACRKVTERIQSLADSFRHAISRLRPDLLDHLGLIPTIEWFIEDFRERMPEIAIEFQPAGFKRRIAPDAEIVLYRLFQEGLNNVAKHAAARHVDIMLTCSHPEVIFVMKDDGVGFDQSESGGMLMEDGARGIGLLSMKERVASLGGKVEIKSIPGKGTVIWAELPLDGKKAK